MSIKNSSNTPLRAALVGAGYIAQWHAAAIRATPGVELTAICDVATETAKQLADTLGVRSFSSIDTLISENICDAVHILTPPHTHRELAVKSLAGGLHALVEKPFATSKRDCELMTGAAQTAERIVAVSHNFLGIPGYSRLKAAVAAGELGRIATAEFNWHFPLEPLRSGPFGLWMLRKPENLLLELGPHLYAFAVDLFGKPTDFHVAVSKPIAVPGGGEHFQSWRILARTANVDLAFNLSLVETMDDRSITLHGSSATAKLDYANDVLVFQVKNASDIVLNPFKSELSSSYQHLRQGTANALRQAFSLNQASPYALGFRGAVQSFYDAIRNGTPIDQRFSGASATTVIGAIEETIALLPGKSEAIPLSRPQILQQFKPSVVVIGGTGFIGRNLTRALALRGYKVRVLSRGNSRLFDDLADSVETVPVSLKDESGLRAAMDGTDAVFHLAKSLDTTWQGCLENDVGTTLKIAEAALASGVKRFVYTGTIASYDMSSSDRAITEDTAFDSDMSDRNLYARSKAQCEKELSQLHRARGLPLVIARPGIVVGSGGPLQHWGIGRWHGAGAVRIWGQGHNILPFVLIDDVSEGLIRMIEVDEAVGRSFNLVGEPMFSARDYFQAIHQHLGAKIAVRPSSLLGFYLADAVKFGLKRYALGKKGISRPSLRDWKSRAHLSAFRIDQPKQVLGWRPVADRATFIRKAIVEPNLFGF